MMRVVCVLCKQSFAEETFVKGKELWILEGNFRHYSDDISVTCVCYFCHLSGEERALGAGTGDTKKHTISWLGGAVGGPLDAGWESIKYTLCGK